MTDVEKTIERAILKKLMYNSKQSYNELWDKKECPSSKFNYYIKKLISKDLMSKDSDNKYILTNKGNQYIAELNTKKLQKQSLPIVCSFVLCVNEDNQILLQERKKQPYLGLLNIPGGKVEFAENTYDAGVRELYEESKLTAHSMELKVIDEIRTFYESKEKFAHIMAFMYVCKEFSGILEQENQEGKMFWVSFEEIKKDAKLHTKKYAIFPNLIDVIDKIMNTSSIIVQETIRYKDETGLFTSHEINKKI